MGTAGRAIVENEFNTQTLSDALIAFYHQTLRPLKVE